MISFRGSFLTGAVAVGNDDFRGSVTVQVGQSDGRTSLPGKDGPAFFRVCGPRGSPVDHGASLGSASSFIGEHDLERSVAIQIGYFNVPRHIGGKLLAGFRRKAPLRAPVNIGVIDTLPQALICLPGISEDDIRMPVAVEVSDRHCGYSKRWQLRLLGGIETVLTAPIDV